MSMSTRPPISTWPRPSCSTPRCGAPASAARPRPCWSIARRRANSSSPGVDADRCRLRSARRRRGAQGRCARQARDRGRLVGGISRRHHRREGRRRRRRRDRAYRALRLASHRRDRHRRRQGAPRNSWRRSIPPSCCTTPRRNSPMAANSASARRSASRPARMHARGPVGVEQLTSFKYRVRGIGTDAAVKEAAADARQKRHQTARRASAARRRPAHRVVRRLVQSAA